MILTAESTSAAQPADDLPASRNPWLGVSCCSSCCSCSKLPLRSQRHLSSSAWALAHKVLAFPHHRQWRISTSLNWQISGLSVRQP
jgi:hypothetical protein